MTFMLFACGSASAAEPGESKVTEDRLNFLTPSHNTLPDVRDELAILTVKVCSERSNIFLQRVSIEHTLTKQRYVFRPNPVQDSGDWTVMTHVGKIPMMTHVTRNGFVQHTVFMDVPAGRYQITDLRMTRERSAYSYASVNGIEGLFFWYDDYDPLSYLGELNISFKDGFSSAPTLFVTRSSFSHIKDIRARYAGVVDQKVGEGNLWLQGPTGGMAKKGEVVCQFP